MSLILYEIIEKKLIFKNEDVELAKTLPKDDGVGDEILYKDCVLDAVKNLRLTVDAP